MISAQKAKGQKPEIIDAIKKVDAKEGDQIILKLKVLGFPQPEVTFTRNGKELKEDKRIEVTSNDDGEWVLTVNNAVTSDAGVYIGIAKNEHGEANSQAEVTVIEEKR